MSPSDPDLQNRLQEAANAIADGQAVDWEEVTVALGDSDAHTSLENLRQLEALASAFRAATTLESKSDRRPTPLFTWGHLEVLEKLGEGGFGEVYRAYDTTLDREVALKLRRAGESGIDGGGHGFVREARRLARLRHPHVVSVYGTGEHAHRVGFWTELIEGETLSNVIDRQGPMDAAEALAVGLEICNAVAAVHGAGLIHGDIKPANVMRDQEGQFVLMDLGSATFMRAGAVWPEVPQGTPVAMAPEVLGGANPTVASDIYSLGVLLYYLVCGTYPARAETFEELRQLHRDGELARLQERRSDLPHSFLEIVERALAPDPKSRYRSAEAMEQAIAGLLGSAGQELQRSRPLAWLSASAGIVALAALGSWVWITYGTSDQNELGLDASSGTNGVGTAAARCISNAQCSKALDGPAICPQPGQPCVSLISADCPIVLGDYEDERAVFVGLMASFSGPTPQHREWARAHQCAVEMAMDWWGENPLPLGGSSDRHPVSMVLCDGNEGHERSLDHLVNTLGVRIVGGPNFSRHVLTRAPELAAKGVFMLSPTAGAPQLLEMADNQLFWSIQPNDASFLTAYPTLVAFAEKRVREDNGNRDVAVALLADGDSMSRGIAQNLIETESLIFNALSATRQTGTRFCPVYLCDSVTEPDCSNAASVSRLTDCDPDIVIYLAINLQWVELFMARVERAGTQPYWLFPFRDAEVLKQIRSGAFTADMPNRVLAIDWTNEQNPTFAKFKASFAGACSEHVPPAVDGFPPLTENYYDWVFLAHLLYLGGGNFQAAPEQLTGEDYASALVSLGGQPGTPVELVSGNIPGMIQSLVEGEKVDLHGASGALEFDPRLGTPSRQGEVFCISLGSEPPGTVSWASAGLAFEPGAGQFDGAFACPR